MEDVYGMDDLDMVLLTGTIVGTLICRTIFRTVVWL